MQAKIILHHPDEEIGPVEVLAAEDFIGTVYILQTPISFAARDGSGQTVTYEKGQKFRGDCLHFL